MIRSILAIVSITSAALAGEPRLDQFGDPLPEGAIARFGTVRHRIGAYGSLWSWALSPDGKTIAAEDRNGITLWDIETGKPLKQFPRLPSKGDSPLSGLCFSPDGKSLARLGGELVAVIDASTGKERFQRDLGEKVVGLAYLPGGEKLFVACGKPKVVFLDARSGKQHKTLDVDLAVQSVSASGKYFLGLAETVPYVVDAASGKLVCRFDEAKADMTPSWQLSPDEKKLYVAQRKGRLQTFDVQTGRKLQDIETQSGEISGTDLTLSPDGRIAYVSVPGMVTQRRDLKEDRWLNPLPASFGGPVFTLAHGKRALQIGNDGVLRRFDLATLKQLPAAQGFEGHLFTIPTPDGRRFLTRSGDRAGGRFEVFEVNGKRLWSIENPTYALPPWSPDSRALAFVGDKKIVFRNSLTGNETDIIQGSGDEGDFSYGFYSAAGGQFVVVIDYGRAIATFDCKTRRRISFVPAEAHSVVNPSPDGQTLVFNSSERGIALFDLSEMKFRSTRADAGIFPRSSWLPYPTFSPDGSYLLTWGSRMHFQPWNETVVAIPRDPVTLERKMSFDIQLNDPFSFAVSPNGLWLAIGNHDGELSFWDLRLGKQIARWKGHRDNISDVGFMGLGRVLTSSPDLTALLWDLRPKEKPAKALWSALSGNDALEAYRAIWAIADDPKGADLLRSKIAPAKAADAVQVNRCVANLGADKFATREAASKELQALGRLIEPELRSFRAKATSEEVRRRLDTLIAKIPRERIGIEIVHARAVAAMEIAASDSAKKLLAEWADGAPGARLTIDAKAALGRLNAVSSK